MHRYPSTRPIGDSGFTIANEILRNKEEDSSFGPRLAALRKARGLTQLQLAESTGTAVRLISYYETGGVQGDHHGR